MSTTRDTTRYAPVVDGTAQDVEMTCLGCYATRDPGEELTGCACENGYTIEAGQGILDSRFYMQWFPSEVADRVARGLVPAVPVVDGLLQWDHAEGEGR